MRPTTRSSASRLARHEMLWYNGVQELARDAWPGAIVKECPVHPARALVILKQKPAAGSYGLGDEGELPVYLSPHVAIVHQNSPGVKQGKTEQLFAGERAGSHPPSVSEDRGFFCLGTG
jgi:hypothetical protein